MIVRNIPLRNVMSRSLAVCIEPWGERHILQSGEAVRVVFYGPAGGEPEILLGESEISVYGWEQSQVFVLRDNVCVSQPALLDVMRRLFTAHEIDEAQVDLEPELIDFAQKQLDAAPAWDKNGQVAALTAVSKVAPLFSKLHNEAFVWAFCQRVLHSRGVFLRTNPGRFREFRNALETEFGDLFTILAEWHEASVESTAEAERTLAD